MNEEIKPIRKMRFVQRQIFLSMLKNYRLKILWRCTRI